MDRRWDWAAIVFLVVTTALRLPALSRLELAPDEAYYWDWSRHLALGYYDQGPMIAYLIRATTALFGTNEFGVRFGVLAASLGTLLCAYMLARRIFGSLAGFLTIVLLGLTPLMAVGSLIATYDPPLVFFWALAALFLERALFAPSARQQRAAWLWSGFATGLGFLSKHTMLLLIPCLLLFLALSPTHRRWLRRPEPYLAFLIPLLLYSGVFWWNAHHHWWTFQHLLFLTGKSSGTPLRRFGDFLGSQALLLGPALFLAALAACWSGLRTAWRAPFAQDAAALFGRAVNDPSRGPSANRPHGRKSSSLQGNAEFPDTCLEQDTAASRRLFLACLGLPVFLFFCLLALKAKVQGNWLPFAWVTPTILWAGWAAERAETSRRSAWKIAGLAGLLAVTSGALTLLMAFPTLRAEAGIHLPPDTDPSNTTTGWRQLAAHVQQIRQEMQRQGHKVFLAGNGYQYCALLAFYLPDHPQTYDLFLHFRLTMYAAYVDRLKAHLGEDAIFVNDGQADDKDLRKIFTTVQWNPPFPIWRRPFYTEPIRTIYIARCYRYRRYIGLDWALGG